MAMTIVGTDPDAVIGGVDTHADVHVAAAVNHVGGVFGNESFPTTQRVSPVGVVAAVTRLQESSSR